MSSRFDIKESNASRPKRAEQSADEVGPIIRLESDYMCGVPLWGRSGCLNGSPKLELSSELRADLVGWQT